MIHIVFGPSGSGKTEFCKKIRELKQQGENISLHSKKTTRDKRGYDEDEIETLNDVQFESWRKEQSAYVYERENSSGTKYRFGISKLDITKAINNKESHFIICNDIKIALAIRKDFSFTKVRLLFLLYNAKPITIKEQIEQKLLFEYKQEGKSISPSDKIREIQYRYKRITSLNRIFEDNKHEFDGVIFNQYAPASLKTDSLSKMKQQIINEVYFDEYPAFIKNNSVFVITPMGKINKKDYGNDYPNDPEYFNKTKAIINKTCSSRGLHCLNFDTKSGSDIIGEIHRQILEANYIIFDISANRPNCYYEYGLAKYLKKKVVILCNDTTKSIKFDLSNLRYAKYTLETLEEVLNKELDNFNIK